MADNQSTSDVTTSYLQKFDHDYPGGKYAWFSKMLHGHYSDPFPTEGSVKFSNIRLVDDISQDMSFTSDTKFFDATKGREVDNDFVEALNSHASDTSVRLIVLHFSRMYDLNFSYLAYLGSRLDIDPLFFVMHFEHSRARHARYWRYRAPAMLPLESRFLQFCYDPYGRTTVTVLKSDISKVDTVVMLLESGRGIGSCKDMPAMAFARALSQLQISKEPIIKKIAPIEYVAPLLHAAAVEDTTFLDQQRDRITEIEVTPRSAEQLAATWRDLQSRALRLDGITRNLSKALLTPKWSQGLSMKQISRLHKEYIALIKLNNSLSEYTRDRVQQMSSLQSILETRKGLQQADSVKRLTLVAMFFIPLSFATSFLGMNVEQFGTGKIDIGFFFLAAVLAGGITIALTSVVKPLDRAIYASRERIANDIGWSTEDIGKRDILRQSNIGQRVITAMTVTDSDGNAIYEDYSFREVFRTWCGFHFRKLWATITRTHSRERSAEA